MTDTEVTTQVEPSAPPQPGSPAERGIDFVEVHRDERLDAYKDRSENFSDARSASDEIIRRRKETQAGRDYRDVEAHIEQRKWDDGTADRNASGTQSDLPHIAERLTELRRQQKDMAAKYLEANYGADEQQGAATTDNTASQQTEQQAQQEAINAQSAGPTAGAGPGARATEAR